MNMTVKEIDEILSKLTQHDNKWWKQNHIEKQLVEALEIYRDYTILREQNEQLRKGIETIFS